MSQQSDTFKNVAVIDLADGDESVLIQAVAQACSTAGFFQIVNHGIPDDLVQAFRAQCRAYFTELPQPIKDRQRRHDTNARGYFDDELTKQRLDWKQALDVGVPGSRDWTLPDDDPRNACLDGFNQFPSESELPGFRTTVVQYFEACADLSHRIATLMQAGIVGTSEPEDVGEVLGCVNDDEDYDGTGVHIVEDLRRHHTSYLRMNYYPIYLASKDSASVNGETSPQDPSPLGISPHRDAGFLTVLLQDDDCHSLQVYHPETASWHLVTPVPGAVTINTGDMAQIWSNGRYRAPLHRVLTHPSSVRFSAPFFYNPGYSSYLRPVQILSKTSEHLVEATTNPPRYHPCLWGYFRAVRFAGDLTDLGVEIQVDDFEIVASDNEEDDKRKAGSSGSQKHLTRQARFAELARCDQPFSVNAFRDLLTG